MPRVYRQAGHVSFRASVRLWQRSVVAAGIPHEQALIPRLTASPPSSSPWLPRSARELGVFRRMKPPQARYRYAASIASVLFKDRWRLRATRSAKHKLPPSSKASASSLHHGRFKKRATPSRPMTASPSGNPRQKKICWQRTASS